MESASLNFYMGFKSLSPASPKLEEQESKLNTVPREIMIIFLKSAMCILIQVLTLGFVMNLFVEGSLFFNKSYLLFREQSFDHICMDTVYLHIVSCSSFCDG